jgi:DNA-binding CsgD family transcriptional regulator
MELLERDSILNELHRLLRQASAGQGSLLLLSGEAGIGKTVLLRRFGEQVRSDATLLLGQCDALSTPPPLGPLLDIAQADSQLRRLLIEDVPRDSLFRTVLSHFRGEPRPTLVAIEDAHWADEATLDFVRYLGRRIETTHALVIVTYRDDEGGSRHPLRQVLGDLAATPAVHRLSVSPLSPEAVTALCKGSDIDPDVLYSRTRGNPFFVTSVLAAGGGIPPTVRDALLARTSRLSTSAWDVLEAAAVIGPTIETGLLNQVAGLAFEGLDACLECGILEQRGQVLTFRHELVREAILTAVAPAREASLHALVLQALERVPEWRDPVRLAHHAEEAGHRSAVLRFAPEAARRAARFRAHREAATQYERALRFADHVAPEERAALLEAQAYEYYLTAQIDRAITARQEALEIWLAQGDRRKEGENRCHLATLHWAEARTSDADREATAAVAALESMPPGPELAMAYAVLGRLRGPTAGAAEGAAWGERAIALAEQFHAVETLADALIDVGATRLAEGDDQGRALIERGLALASQSGFDDLVARGYHNLGFGFGEQFQFARAAPYFSDGIAFCNERDLDHPRLFMTAWLAYCRCFQGEWSEAAALASSVLQACDVSLSARFMALLVTAMLRVRRGQLGANPYLDEALTLAEARESSYFLGPIHALRAEAAWLAGDIARCVAEARAVYDLAIAQQQRWYGGMLAYWCWKGSDLAEPSPIIAEPFAKQITGDAAGAAKAWDALGCQYEAAWARIEGDDEEELRAALSVVDQLGARPAAALARKRLRALGARGVPRGPRPATRANPAGLTRRESEIVALIGAGHSNQQIASRLFLSTRTVENHVSAILIKLGAGSRREAASAAERLGLIPQSE